MGTGTQSTQAWVRHTQHPWLGHTAVASSKGTQRESPQFREQWCSEWLIQWGSTHTPHAPEGDAKKEVVREDDHEALTVAEAVWDSHHSGRWRG